MSQHTVIAVFAVLGVALLLVPLYVSMESRQVNKRLLSVMCWLFGVLLFLSEAVVIWTR